MISEHASPLAAAGGVDAGGQNIYVDHMARCLAEAGHHVDVLTRRDSRDLAPVVDMRSGARVIHIPAGPARFVPKEQLLQHMAAFARMTSGLVARSVPYDLVHANFFMSGIVARRLKAEWAIPYAVTFHAVGLVRREHQGDADGFPAERAAIERSLVQGADRVIAECPQDQDDLVRLYGGDPARMPMVVQAQVEAHEAGLLFIDGKLTERLPAGRHAFWAVGRTVKVQKVDTRPTPLEVTAQEILTKDRVGIRVTLTAFTRVVDPEKAALAAGDVGNTVYRLVQFAIREAVATRTLDEILAARDTIDREVRGFVAERAAGLGVEIGEIGVKDVILPGDVRELLNKVVEAERVAKANLIRRQEETAATRSLLNTSKLMEDNPLLLRLKELEALEKLVEKVGRIDLHAGAGGGGFDALLQNLYKLSRDKDEPKD